MVLRQLPGQAVDAGHCPPVAQVGHDHLAVFDENTGGCNGRNTFPCLIRKENLKDPSFRFDLPSHKRVGEVGTGGRKRQHWHVAETS